ncbi:subtilisin-like protein [Thozetella sp. PMI_491]|nr:subtilisin-like protein [Thozetella sp. PMI_491]
MLFRSLVAAFGLGMALEVLASPMLNIKREVPTSHALHERHTEHMAEHWVRRSKVPRDSKLPMRIGLTQSNLVAGHDRLMAISDPASEHYGKHMSSEEVIEFFAPPPSTVEAVLEWLVAAGISRSRLGVSFNKQWIQFDASAEEAGNLLYTDFYYFEDPTGEHEDVGVSEYHLPTSIREHVDYITPGIRLRPNKKRDLEALKKKKRDTHGLAPGNTSAKSAAGAQAAAGLPGVNSTSCAKYITADCTRAQYGIPVGSTKAQGNELGIFEHLGDHYSTTDLDDFLATLHPEIPTGSYPENRLVDGAIGSSEDLSEFFGFFVDPGVESNLDFQAAIPLVWPQTTVLFQTDDEYYEEVGTPGFLNTFLDAIDGSYCTYSAYGETGDSTDPESADPTYPDPFWSSGYQGERQCGAYKPTNVISISYGGIEVLMPDSYQKRQCNEYLKLGLQGVTTVISSGDSGVASFRGCIDGTIFTPGFPTTCPYLLTVGSTELNRVDPNAPPTPYEKLDEVATTSFPSGGGFSNIYGVADYQRSAVQAYWDEVQESLPFSGYHQIIKDGDFSNVTRPNQLYHHGGRGFPDVGAVGDRQIINYEGGYYLVGGTSLSAPVWASVLTLINEKRIAAGKSTLGFVNPILYAHPEAFNDVTGGSNPGCGTDGFPAAKGWDPVTGLG